MGQGGGVFIMTHLIIIMIHYSPASVLGKMHTFPHKFLLKQLNPYFVRAGIKNYRSVEYERRNSTFLQVFQNT